ncbi:type II toxin-antitoxin system PemK/MazF family toxin [Ideonella livida]|jgi:mRNA interferase MazF|uniref:mRNA interferase n=1 Tax=Ideonella livida TaxID=2707176 RepID=A0A7C9PKX9_9BURK|nr:type II toxin-antitoxin system PemK/MazF family toxin [Ideonella livida]NDY93794.1 type II toxin-antitoxin system PemK/MazF family toxin [Ideonella livida]
MPQIAVVRGDIVLVDLSGAVGGEKQNDKVSGSRPCVVVQNDGGNRGSPLTIVAPLTDQAQYKGYPQQVLVTAAELGTGAGKDSIIECGHLRSIDRDARIKKHLGKVTAAVMPRIDAALKASLGLR